MAGFEQTEGTQTAPAADTSSHVLGDIWSKVKSTASDAADGAAKFGHKVVDATPGVLQEGVTKAKSLDTAHNRAIAEKAGKAGAKAAIFGPHAAALAAGASVLEQTTGHKMPVNPLNIKGEIAKRVIDGATGTATGSDSPHPPTGFFIKGIIKDTASKYLPQSTIADESEATHIKR
jgi:hypothetical protein